MAFLEIEFPRAIAFHRIGSPSGWLTTVNQGISGQEQRNQNWGSSRGKWTCSVRTPSAAQRGSVSQANFVEILLAFHLNAGGKAIAFRLKDALDDQFTNQQIGVGTGSSHTLQLIKSYTIGGRTYIRNITKPIWHTVTDYAGNALTDTVTLAFNGTPQTYGVSWTLDPTTGLVTCTAPNTDVITASGQFHYPVRFDVDELPMRVEESDVAGGNPIVTIDSCPLVEVLPPNY